MAAPEKFEEEFCGVSEGKNFVFYMVSTFLVSVLHFEPENKRARAIMQTISQMLKNSKGTEKETVGHFNPRVSVT